MHDAALVVIAIVAGIISAALSYAKDKVNAPEIA
jgi:hypothetical protein